MNKKQLSFLSSLICCFVLIFQVNDIAARSIDLIDDFLFIPTIICPDPIIQNATTGDCGAIIEYASQVMVQDDGLNPPLTWNVLSGPSSGDFIPVCTVTVTLQGMNGAGELSEPCSFDITVLDRERPTFDVCPFPGNIESVNDPGLCGAIINFNTDVIPSDNCGISTWAILGAPSGSLFPVGITPVFYFAIDVNGNIGGCGFNVTITEFEPPTLTCSEPVIESAIPGTCAAFVCVPQPIIEDNCLLDDPEPQQPCENLPTPPQFQIVNDYNNTSSAFDTYPIGRTRVNWTVTDASGNSSTCSMEVFVEDHEPPVIDCSGIVDPVLNNSFRQCNYRVTTSQFDPIANDNCGATLINNFNGQSTLIGARIPVGITPITWTATDDAGNTDQCTIIFEVVDAEIPLIFCSSNLTIGTDLGECERRVFYSLFSRDNCPGIVLTQTAGLVSGDIFPLGVTANSFVVTDAAGNSNACSFNVIVVDIEPPEITVCNEPITADSEIGVCGAFVNNPWRGQYRDNCSETCDCFDEVVFNLTTDNFGGETTWQLTVDGEIFQTGGPYNSNIDIVEVFIVDASNAVFTIFDLVGDGICCDFGIGSYSLSVNGNEVANGGVFGFEESTDLSEFSDCDSEEKQHKNAIQKKVKTVAKTTSYDVAQKRKINKKHEDAKNQIQTSFNELVTTEAIKDQVHIDVPKTVFSSTKNRLPSTVNSGRMPCEFDQLIGDGTEVVNSQIFTDFTGIIVEGVDDFDVPENEYWQVSSVEVLGAYISGAGFCESGVRINVYQDANDAPGMLIHTEDVAVVNAPNYVCTLSEPLPLLSGKYWLGVQGMMSFTSCGQWGIRSNNNIVGINSFARFNTSIFSANNFDLAFKVNSDDCSPPPDCIPTLTITNDITGTEDASGIYPVGRTIVSWIARDGEGNETRCYQLIKVKDIEDPTLTCPENMVVGTDLDSCNAVVEYEFIANDNCPFVLRPPPTVEINLGDIAFVGYHADPTQQFAFIALVDIAVGAEIHFTENGWLADGGFFEIENTIKWTATEIVEAGTVVMVTDYIADTGIIDGTLNLEVNGDQLFAYQGDAPTADDLSGFISAIHMNGNWDPEAINTNTSTMPEVFMDGETSMFISPEKDNGLYVGIVHTGSAAVLREAIYDDINWKVSNFAFGLISTPFAVHIPSVPNEPSLVGGLPSGSVFPIGPTTITYEVIDGSFHSAQCDFTITVEDTQGPEIDCPENILVSVPLAAGGAIIEFEIVAIDNCSAELVIEQFDTSGLSSGDFFPFGSTFLKFRVTDEFGNISFCFFDVIVQIEEVNETKNIRISDEFNTNNSAYNDLEVTIYPNPNDGRFSIDIESFLDEANVLIRIFDMNGTVLDERRTDLVFGRNTEFVNLSAYPNGLYYVNIEGSSFQEYLRIIKQ